VIPGSGTYVGNRTDIGIFQISRNTFYADVDFSGGVHASCSGTPETMNAIRVTAKLL